VRCLQGLQQPTLNQPARAKEETVIGVHSLIRAVFANAGQIWAHCAALCEVRHCMQWLLGGTLSLSLDIAITYHSVVALLVCTPHCKKHQIWTRKDQQTPTLSTCLTLLSSHRGSSGTLSAGRTIRPYLDLTELS
jgi:hypothetical protein